MSSIQPGDGYNLTASSSGFTLDVTKPWTNPNGPDFIIGVGVPRLPDPPLPPLPPDFPEPPSFPGLGGEEAKPLQFACRMKSLNIGGSSTPVLQIAMGSVTYTHSDMPLIKRNAFVDHRQAYINFAAVLSAGATAAPLAETNSPWMLGGGGYAMSGTGRWFVTLTKWDAGNGEFDGGLLDQNLPWVSIVKDGSAEFDAIFVDAGPSLYENQMNVQKMTGYDAASTGFATDWGHCHTTWFNPRFFGNHTRVLAVIDSVPSPGFTVDVTEIRAGGTSAGNEVQQIVFAGVYNSGTVTFTHDGVTTTTAFNPTTQFAYDLQVCLSTIPALSGNIYVQAVGPGVYQVEFTNFLRNTNIANLTPNSSITSFANWYTVYQCNVGSQDIVIPCELNSTQLMNKDGVTEAVDPYNLNAATTPVKWANVVNYEDAYAASALGFIPGWATPVINDTVPRTFTTRLLDYGAAAGCTDEEGSTHPFKVIHDLDDAGNSTYSIISGTVNNLVPTNVSSPITVATALSYVYIKVPYVSPNFPANNTNFVWGISATMPADTDAFGYVKVADVNGSTVTQYVTGSLWADRLKLGSSTAQYYFARI